MEGGTSLGIDELPIFSARPSIGATRLGRLVGRAASVTTGWGVFTLGNLLAVLLLPLALAMFFWLRMPFVCRRYILTARRVLVSRGLGNTPYRSISLDEFDRIDLEFLPGQQWLRCGEVIFRRGQTELLRFSGVACPEVLRRCCQQAQQAILATAHAAQQQQTIAGRAC